MCNFENVIVVFDKYLIYKCNFWKCDFGKIWYIMSLINVIFKNVILAKFDKSYHL